MIFYSLSTGMKNQSLMHHFLYPETAVTTLLHPGKNKV